MVVVAMSKKKNRPRINAQGRPNRAARRRGFSLGTQSHHTWMLGNSVASVVAAGTNGFYAQLIDLAGAVVAMSSPSGSTTGGSPVFPIVRKATLHIFCEIINATAYSDYNVVVGVLAGNIAFPGSALPEGFNQPGSDLSGYLYAICGTYESEWIKLRSLMSHRLTPFTSQNATEARATIDITPQVRALVDYLAENPLVLSSSTFNSKIVAIGWCNTVDIGPAFYATVEIDYDMGERPLQFYQPSR